jgi:integrase
VPGLEGEDVHGEVVGQLVGDQRLQPGPLVAQVDLAGKTISIERTEWFEPKSEESARLIDLDDLAVEIIREAKAEAPDPIFVLKGALPKPQTKAATVYRCDVAPWRTWKKLGAWLASKGIQDGKPIHVLRKLAGSLVFAAHGLEQARGFLGHASISTTSDSYLAASRRVTVSIPAPTDEVSTAARAARSTGTEGPT